MQDLCDFFRVYFQRKLQMVLKTLRGKDDTQLDVIGMFKFAHPHMELVHNLSLGVNNEGWRVKCDKMV